MNKDLIHDPILLGIKSESATKEDLQKNMVTMVNN